MKYYFYKSYGLSIKSSINIPELELTSREKGFDRDVDVSIKIDNIFYSHLKDDNHEIKGITKVRNNANDIDIFWNHKLLFNVKNGKEIIVNSNVDINPTFLRSLILGRAMGTLLHQRGFLVLHASAVNIDGSAVAFLGRRGNGKSTTTMALINSNYPLVADDVLAIKIEDNIALTIPSFPKIKLRQDIMESFTEKIDLDAQIHPDIKKYYYAVKNFSYKPLPLKIIYILEKGNKSKISSLETQEAIINLIRHSYCVSILEGDEQQENLKQCANIIKSVHVKCLNTNHHMDKLNSLAKLIEKDINESTISD
jgi:hypothetical protein